jgi:hypothetical protein
VSAILFSSEMYSSVIYLASGGVDVTLSQNLSDQSLGWASLLDLCCQHTERWVLFLCRHLSAQKLRDHKNN